MLLLTHTFNDMHICCVQGACAGLAYLSVGVSGGCLGAGTGAGSCPAAPFRYVVYSARARGWSACQWACLDDAWGRAQGWAPALLHPSGMLCTVHVRGAGLPVSGRVWGMPGGGHRGGSCPAAPFRYVVYRARARGWPTCQWACL